MCVTRGKRFSKCKYLDLWLSKATKLLLVHVKLCSNNLNIAGRTSNWQCAKYMFEQRKHVRTDNTRENLQSDGVDIVFEIPANTPDGVYCMMVWILWHVLARWMSAARGGLAFWNHSVKSSYWASVYGPMGPCAVSWDSPRSLLVRLLSGVGGLDRQNRPHGYMVPWIHLRPFAQPGF